ncbi:MAG TPA: YitT family protein [Spirochaetota bacterium]|nr:YitT family protein [Spirochaetota bacterium]HPJ33348.1 YitT family protein [Spirochaetota bacterium]
MYKFFLKKGSIADNIKDLIGVMFGCAVGGFGLSLFLIPFKASPGGAAGVAQIFYYLFNIPAGVMMFIINVPLFIVGVMIFGRMFGVKTLWGIFCLSFFTDLFNSELFLGSDSLYDFLFTINEQTVSFTNEPFLGVVAGSLLLGLGAGIVIRFNGSTGGSDIPALIIRKYFGLTVGMSYLMIDSVIIFSVGIVFKNPNLILWGFVSLYITTRGTDFIVEGLSYTKELFIISSDSEKIKKYILDDLDRGYTLIKGEGGYTGEVKDVIYVALHTRELPKIKARIKEADPKAFVVVNDAYEVLGDFRR